MKARLSGLCCLIVGSAFISTAQADKVTFCRKTNSAKNPYQLVSVGENAYAKTSSPDDVAPGDWYPDADGDGYGDDSASPTACPSSESDVLTTGDCDDTNASVNPGQQEILYDGLDNDCNPATGEDDIDNDGYGVADDCDDTNPAVHPGATEVAYDGLDNDCDAATLDDDLDGDGFPIATDCDDSNPNVHPGTTEIFNNGIDENCNPSDDLMVWDFAEDFTILSNPNGPWTYGYYHPNQFFPRQDFDLLSSVGWIGPTTVCVLPDTLSNDFTNIIAKNTSDTDTYGECSDWCLTPGMVATNPNGNDTSIAVRFTAPQTGNYRVEIGLNPIDQQATGGDVVVKAWDMVFGTTLLEETLGGYGSESRYTGTMFMYGTGSFEVKLTCTDTSTDGCVDTYTQLNVKVTYLD